MTQAPDTEALLRERLAALAPRSIEIADDSAAHAGHGSAGKGGHYRLRIVSEAFAGKPRLARHRLVFDALGDLMHARIHALVIDAKSPEEA
ncbi:BolA family protein [Propionivibrio dicarboxylicus]|uniref:BolA protein n=1 Tax=Propionivibrio dicarboxylicus TaxID=83767 RepID=A0A1G7ZJK8_9RHOO|nr:BolA family protein [Propionivibrio dicarboxylicus]SDH08932.1 BolA protein [Propionivibrio dicarboxylicus]